MATSTGPASTRPSSVVRPDRNIVSFLPLVCDRVIAFGAPSGAAAANIAEGGGSTRLARDRDCTSLLVMEIAPPEKGRETESYGVKNRRVGQRRPLVRPGAVMVPAGPAGR